MSYGHSIKRRFAFFFSGKPKNDEVLLVKHWTENQHQHEFELQIFFIYLGLPICNISIRKPLEATWSIFGGRHESNDSIEKSARLPVQNAPAMFESRKSNWRRACAFCRCANLRLGEEVQLWQTQVPCIRWRQAGELDWSQILSLLEVRKLKYRCQVNSMFFFGWIIDGEQGEDLKVEHLIEQIPSILNANVYMTAGKPLLY